MVSKEKFVTSDNLNLWTQQLTDGSVNQACVLISGAGAPAMFWTDEFCTHLVDNGYSVIALIIAIKVYLMQLTGIKILTQ